jgi:hypothetical protein
MASRAAIWLLIPISVGMLRAQQSQVRTFRFAATDAKGKPVSDLHLDEIRISEAGKPDTVAFLRFATMQASASTLILLDLFNADFTEQSNACQEIILTLTQLPSSGNVFLFLLAPDTSLFAIHAWTTPESPWTGQIGDLLKQGLQTVGKLKHANSIDPTQPRT